MPRFTLFDAISDLPFLGNDEENTRYATAPQNDYQRIMRGMGEITGIEKSTVLSNHVSPNHPQETIDSLSQSGIHGSFH